MSFAKTYYLVILWIVSYENLTKVRQRPRHSAETWWLCKPWQHVSKFLYVFVCVCVYTCVCVYMCMLARFGWPESPMNAPACVSPVLGLRRYAAIPGLYCRVLGNGPRFSYLYSKNFADSHLPSPACIYKIIYKISICLAHAFVGNQRRIFLKLAWFYLVQPTPLRVT